MNYNKFRSIIIITKARMKRGYESGSLKTIGNCRAFVKGYLLTNGLHFNDNWVHEIVVEAMSEMD